MRNFKILAFAVVLLSVAIPLSAHHGNSAFDSQNKLSLKGTVTEWYWANPHCILQFDVKDDKGQTMHWATETSNPADMVNRGWSKFSLKAGDQVTVTFEPAKNGTPTGRVLQVVFPNGEKKTGGFGTLESPGDAAGPKSNDSSK